MLEGIEILLKYITLMKQYTANTHNHFIKSKLNLN